MPWDETTLWVADIESDGSLSNTTALNTDETESVLDLQWAEDGTLYFMADRSGFWNLYRYRDGTIQQVIDRDSDFAGPLWFFGQRNYIILSTQSALVTYRAAEGTKLAAADLDSGTLAPIETPFTSISGMAQVQNRIYILVGTPDAGIVRVTG